MNNSLVSQILEHLRMRTKTGGKKTSETGSAAPEANGSNASNGLDTAFSKLLGSVMDRIEMDLSGSRPLIYEQGRINGKILVEDNSPHLLAIREQYENFGKLLKKVAETESIQEVEEARIKARILEGNLAAATSRVDESNEQSKIRKLQRKIEERKAQLEQYEKDNYENFFHRKYYEVLEQRLKDDQEFIKRCMQERADLRTNLTQPMVEYTRDAIAQNGSQASPSPEESPSIPVEPPVVEPRKSWWTSFTQRFFPNRKRTVPNRVPGKEFPHEKLDFIESVSRKVGEIDSIKEHILRQKISNNVSPVYDGILNGIKDYSPLIPPRRQILIHYLIAILILFGEFYLVFEVLTRVLNFEVPLTFWGYLNPPINLAIISFCLAYPLAIGMLIKFRFSNPANREALKRKFSRDMLGYVVVSLVLIGVLAGIVLLQSESEIVDLIGTFVTDNPESYLALFKTLAMSIFLPVITIVFATVGAIFLSEAFDMHKQYRHVTKSPLWKRPSKLKKDRQDYQSTMKAEVDALEEEIDQLNQEKEDLESEFVKAQALVNAQKYPPTYEELIATLQSIAVSLYLSGYEIGKAETLSGRDETDLLLYLKKRKII